MLSTQCQPFDLVSNSRPMELWERKDLSKNLEGYHKKWSAQFLLATLENPGLANGSPVHLTIYQQ